MKTSSKAVLIGIIVLVAIFFANASYQLLNSPDEKENGLETIFGQDIGKEQIIKNTIPLNEFVFSVVGENVSYDGETGVYYHDHDATKIYDDFSNWPAWKGNFEEPISPNAKWQVLYTGGGSMKVVPDYDDPSNMVMVLEPEFAPEQTRAPLLLTTDEYSDFRLSMDVRTDKSLRPDPNPWEVAWVIWRHVDDTHFYYFTLKPNGTECGKYDGGVNPVDQMFICSSSFPTTYSGKWDHWDIIVKADHITILVNGKIIHDFDDFSSFNKGKIGLYNEDSRTSFDNVTIIPLE
ncbi:MAG: DUF1080 domain-containing protein [Nitrosopumilaceae archaeon]|jgi:hypothetical protein